MSDPTRAAAESSARDVLAAFSRLMIDSGLGFGDFVEIAKWAYVTAARNHLADRHSRPTTSRLAIVTGLTRQEVSRIVRDRGPRGRKVWHMPRAERVLHGWFNDPMYLDSNGKPRTLKLTGRRSFSTLVKKHAGDIPHTAMFKELIEAGLIAKSGTDVTPIRRIVSSRALAKSDLEDFGNTVQAVIANLLNNIRPQSSQWLQREISAVVPSRLLTPSVSHTVGQRTERFLQALSVYLNDLCPSDSATRMDKDTEVLRIMLFESRTSGTVKRHKRKHRGQEQ